MVNAQTNLVELVNDTELIQDGHSAFINRLIGSLEQLFIQGQVAAAQRIVCGLHHLRVDAPEEVAEGRERPVAGHGAAQRWVIAMKKKINYQLQYQLLLY